MPSSSFYNANLTASATTANILAGDINEFIAVPSVVTIYHVSSAIGVATTVLADSDVAINRKEIPFIGTTLNKKDHMIDSFAVAGGTRMAIFLSETAAAATTDVYTVVEVTPLG
jgi:hypothetical protein